MNEPARGEKAGGLRVAIFTSGRFHLLDLARELDALGNEVAFYSHVPRRRAEQFGLPARCHRALLPYVWPFVGLQKKLPCSAQEWVNPPFQWVLDAVMSWRLEPCDVFIGMSGLSVRAARAARERHGAKVFLERGSRHILSQAQILDALGDGMRPSVTAFDKRRELWGYDYADKVVVPSHHAEKSFTERGMPPARLFRNPYGVDLEMFPPTPALAASVPPTVIMVGTWCKRKGCDVLWQACKTANRWRLVHVGSVLDLPLPNSPLFQHHDAVQQWQLVERYRSAHAFVLASREEGLGLVLAQALACGLPVVCTDRTGGLDLSEMLAEPGWVTIVPSDDAAMLGRGIERALGQAAGQTGTRNLLGDRRGQFSWNRYGRRYHDEIMAAAR